MKTKIFLNALRYACIPTIIILVLILFATFSVTDTIEFISSNNTPSVIIRVTIFLLEVGLVWYMYNYDLKQAILNDELTDDYLNQTGKSISSYREVKNLFNNYNNSDNFEIFDTSCSNIKIIKRTLKLD